MQDRYGKGVLGFVENAAEARPAADAFVAAHSEGRLPASFEGRILTIPLADVRLRAPLPKPPSMRDGYAFRQHVETARRNRGLEMIPEFDQFPVFYFTNHHGVVGPGDVPVRPAHLQKLDYELEAAIVVGRGGKNLTASQADDAIFGMTIMNDWSARALQMEEMKLNLGPAKGKDFATSLGPWLVTLDELLPEGDQDRPRPGLRSRDARERQRPAALPGQRGGHDLDLRPDPGARELRGEARARETSSAAGRAGRGACSS